MRYSMAFVAAAATISSVSAVSTFAVVNHCDFDLYLWSVAGNQPASKMFTLPANTPHVGYSEKYRYAGQYEGVSIKVAPYYMGDGQVPSYSLNVTQLEYTVPPPENNDPSIYYDLSMVNGNALMGIPFSYSPSNPGAVPQCVAGSCSGNYETCTAGYNGAHDDWNTHACPREQDIIFTFCNGNTRSPLVVPTGKVNLGQFSSLTCYGGSCLRKRESEPEPVPEPEPESQPESEAEPMVVCYSAKSDGGVAIVAGLCDNAPSPPPAPAPPAPAATPSGHAALQLPSQAPTSSSTTTPAAVPTKAPAPAPAPAAPATPAPPAPVAAPPVSPLSALQLSSLANTGVTCWLSVDSGETCGVSARSVVETRSPHVHSHRHSHQAFHRRNRIIKSAA